MAISGQIGLYHAMVIWNKLFKGQGQTVNNKNDTYNTFQPGSCGNDLHLQEVSSEGLSSQSPDRYWQPNQNS